MLGAGRMGSAAAQRLAAAGHMVRLWNRTAAVARTTAEASDGGVQAVERAEQAVAGTDVVLSWLADGDVTRAVLLDTAVLKALPERALVVDLGTSGVAAAQALHGALSARGVQFVDAPVSGSVPAVRAGTLLVMAAGEAAAVRRAEPVLAAFARRVLHVGPAGAGQVMKLAVNLVVHDLNAAVSEALRLAENAGVARQAAYDVLEQSVVGAPFVQYKRAAFLDDRTEVAMSLQLSLKDLRLICEHAVATGEPVPVTERVRDRVADAVAGGWGRKDMADLSRWPAPPASARPSD